MGEAEGAREEGNRIVRLGMPTYREVTHLLVEERKASFSMVGVRDNATCWHWSFLRILGRDNQASRASYGVRVAASLANPPRWEPYAVKPLVRFCAGGDQQ